MKKHNTRQNELLKKYYDLNSEQKIFALQIRKRVTSISFYKKGEIIPLEKESSPQIFGK